MTEKLVAGVVETPMGWAGVAVTERGIRNATLFHRSRAACEGELRSAGATLGEAPEVDGALGLLVNYASGGGASLDEFPVDLPPCTDFHRAAWLALREIPRGETRSYGWLGRHVGHAESPRAIGAAMGANPIPLWLPCHRVIGSNGGLHGFGGGLEMKRQLLELEGALPRRLV
ncbi:MAG: methylated-DNA--[protein]-cysteine S-methyltransferase [Tepidiformaceae bacterium]